MLPPLQDGKGWPWDVAPQGIGATMPGGHAWPSISIVMPSLNQGAFIEEAIRSVLLQSYPRLELIVVDGGSTDGSVRTIAAYGDSLTAWVSEPDSGPPHALNKGFRQATGDILGFLNADDYLLPNALARVAAEFGERTWADVVSGHGYYATPASELGPPIFSDPWNGQRFVHGACVLVQQATFFRRRAFERTAGFNERRKTSWDMELWADLAGAGATFRVFNEFLAAFRLHPESLTGDLQFRTQCQQDTHEILRGVRGRAGTRRDRLLGLYYRLRKFIGHPRRTVSQRLFFRTTLGRWSL